MLFTTKSSSLWESCKACVPQTALAPSAGHLKSAGWQTTYKQRHAHDWPHPAEPHFPLRRQLAAPPFPFSHANLTILSLTYSSRHQIFIGAVPTCRVRMARLRLESLSLLCLMPFAHAKWPLQGKHSEPPVSGHSATVTMDTRPVAAISTGPVAAIITSLLATSMLQSQPGQLRQIHCQTGLQFLCLRLRRLLLASGFSSLGGVASTRCLFPARGEGVLRKKSHSQSLLTSSHLAISASLKKLVEIRQDARPAIIV